MQFQKMVFISTVVVCVIGMFISVQASAPAGMHEMMQISSANDAQERLKLINQFLKDFPDHPFVPQIIGAKARTLVDLDRHDDAIKFLESQLEQVATAEIKITLASIYLDKQGSLERAEKLAKEAIDKARPFDSSKKPNPRIPDDYYKQMHEKMLAAYLKTYGEILLMRNKLSEAIDILEESNELEYFAETAVLTAKAYKLQGEEDIAYKNLNRVLEKSKVTDPEILAMHKELFVKFEGTEDNYENKLNVLKSTRLEDEKKRLSKQLVEKNAPGFILTTLDGKPIESKDLENKVIILNFWATWCSPCQKELPEFQNAYDALKSENVIFLAISTDVKEVESRVKFYVKKNNYSFPVARDTRLARQFGVTSIPYTVVIGPKGKIRFQEAGYDPKHNLTDRFEALIDLLR